MQLFCPWLTLVFASILFSFNMTLVILLFVLTGLLTSVLIKKEKTISFSNSALLAFGSSVLFVAFTLLLFLGIFLATERYAAETAFAKAVRADRSRADVKTLVSDLDRAATLNQFDDGAYRNLAQALILRVNDELKSASGNSALNDQSKQYIQSLVAAAVNASVRATNLSPHQVSNWTVQGDVYRSLASVVPNAIDFSIKAYQKAILLEPNNPSHWMELGKTNLISADANLLLTTAKDPTIASKAKQDTEKLLREARVSFEKAIALKANFAPAHYQLGLVYEREGKIDLAIGKIESVAKYNTEDVGVAFEIGVLYLKRNGKEDLARAQNAFEHAVKLSPSYSNAHWYLASIYEKQQKRDLAISEIEIVAKLNPGNQIVKVRLDKLKSGALSQEPFGPLLPPATDVEKK
ncbi:MAG: tetratricopeptide repeat protein [Patescibacteria group bacterium]